MPSSFYESQITSFCSMTREMRVLVALHMHDLEVAIVRDRLVSEFPKSSDVDRAFMLRDRIKKAQVDPDSFLRFG